MKHPDWPVNASGHADGAGLVTLSPQAGQAVSFGGEARQLETKPDLGYIF